MFFRTDGVCCKLCSGAILTFSSTEKEAQTLRRGGGRKSNTEELYPPKSLKALLQKDLNIQQTPIRSSNQGNQRQSWNFTDEGMTAKPQSAGNFLL